MARGGKIDLEKFREDILNSREVTAALKSEAEKVLSQEKSRLQDDFNNHPVTKEIDAGPDANNTSNTLGGYGNLFSFIGFDVNSNPVDPVRELINKIRLGKMLKKNLKTGTVSFQVNMPTTTEFESATKMPWEGGRSWLFDIEKTISGLGYYLYGKYNKSRSGTGAQSEKSVRNLAFRPVKYFNKILEDFYRRLK
jgi:hypothetical protein